MTFYDSFMVGVEQYRPDCPYGSKTAVLIPIIKEVPKGLVKKKRWEFLYEFYYLPNGERKVFIGSQVLEEGSYQWFNALKFYTDPEHKYPIELRMEAMALNFEVNGENLSLHECIQNLEKDESFSWSLFGKYQHPLGDELLSIEILAPDILKSFLKCQIKPKKMKSGSDFKLLLTITRNDAYEQRRNLPKGELAREQSPTFGCKGKGSRSGEN